MTPEPITHARRRLPEMTAGRFVGKRALVTGGGSGIGLAIVRGLAREGAEVVAAGLDGDGPAAYFAEPGAPELVSLDVTRAEDIERVVASRESLDVLVNCAGTILRGREHTAEGFARVVDVNLNGTMRVCAAGHDALARSRGSVLNVASMYSYFGARHAPGYSASKGGIVQLTKSLAVAWASDGIRVNAVAPGWIATGFTRAVRDDPRRSAELMERTPLGRWGAPEEVAGAALFLCSPEASFITGAVLPVDGGYSAS